MKRSREFAAVATDTVGSVRIVGERDRAQHTPGPLPGQQYGTQYSCFNCDCDGSPFGFYFKERTEPTAWWIGLADGGQAWYACSDCKDGLHAVSPLFEDGYVPGRAAIAKAANHST